MNINNEIAEARKMKGISQYKLADISGIPQPSIARIERGKTQPTVAMALILLDALGYTLKIVPKNDN